MFVYTYVCVYVCLYVYTYVCMYVYLCVCIPALYTCIDLDVAELQHVSSHNKGRHAQRLVLDVVGS